MNVAERSPVILVYRNAQLYRVSEDTRNVSITVTTGY